MAELSQIRVEICGASAIFAVSPGCSPVDSFSIAVLPNLIRAFARKLGRLLAPRV